MRAVHYGWFWSILVISLYDESCLSDGEFLLVRRSGRGGRERLMQLIKIKHLRPRPLDLGENWQGLGHREGIVQRNGPARPQLCWLGLELHRACRAAPVFRYLLSCGHQYTKLRWHYICSQHRQSKHKSLSIKSADKCRKIRLIEDNAECRHLCPRLRL